METSEKRYYVMKCAEGYLDSVEEDFDTDINYTFTDRLEEAMTFYKYQLNATDFGAPKYLWDPKKKKSVTTVREMCEMFDGEMVEVLETTTWQEVPRSTDI